MNERDIFVAALQIQEPGERCVYLDRACAGDPALRRRVGVLLEAHGQAGRFLERPAAEQIVAVSPRLEQLTKVDSTSRMDDGDADPNSDQGPDQACCLAGRVTQGRPCPVSAAFWLPETPFLRRIL